MRLISIEYFFEVTPRFKSLSINSKLKKTDRLTDLLAFFSFSTRFKYQMTIMIMISIATPVIEPPMALKTGLPTRPELDS